MTSDTLNVIGAEIQFYVHKLVQELRMIGNGSDIGISVVLNGSLSAYAYSENQKVQPILWSER